MRLISQTKKRFSSLFVVIVDCSILSLRLGVWQKTNDTQPNRNSLRLKPEILNRLKVAKKASSLKRLLCDRTE